MILQHFISPLLHGTWMVIQPILWCVQGKAWNTAQQIGWKSDNEHIQSYIPVCAVCKLFLLLLGLRHKAQWSTNIHYSVVIISSNSNKTIQTSKFRILLVTWYFTIAWPGLAGLAGLRHVKYRPWSGQSGSAGHDFITCHLAREFERQVILLSANR
jgi:hypothetical protein